MHALKFANSMLFLSTLSLRRATAPGTSVFRGWTLFLSTLSLRRATCIIDIINNIVNDFYPRSPCGERPNSQQEIDNGHEFLSTLSLRRATNELLAQSSSYSISIHALLAESDSTSDVSANEPLAISIHALLAESD